MCSLVCLFFFCFKQKTAYEMRISDWSSDVCSSDLLYIPPGPRLGDVVIEVNNLAKKFGDRTLYQGVSFSVPRGAIVGIIGANGMGKTTLFKMLPGQDTAYSGESKVGETVKFAYDDQSREGPVGDKYVSPETTHGTDK